MIRQENIAITHGGKFHADDVFSAALLKILNPQIDIVRTFQIPDGFHGIVFDIGAGKYDHHQEGAEVRENGVPYAAFGLLWREFGESILSKCLSEEQTKKEAAHFDEKFIQPLDENDNTGSGNQLADMISRFNPNWDSDESQDLCFSKAVDLAAIILNREFDCIMSSQKAKEIVEAALANSKDNIVILPRFAPWKMVLIPSDAEFVVYPSQRGGYSAQVIPVDFDTKESKCDFPKEWAGKPEDELQRISGIPTLTFCHKGGFLISADCLEDIIKACKLARDL
ncbi:hypothetical protein A7X67_02575 [Clostridium sp. W14A]|nr:hypothetical protein A7X67_02575 [Clostridium sp. W14A]